MNGHVQEEAHSSKCRELVGASRINYLHSALRETHFNVHARLALVQLIKARGALN
jgi:hypothetical protein